jgi:hypothetical protein
MVVVISLDDIGGAPGRCVRHCLYWSVDGTINWLFRHYSTGFWTCTTLQVNRLSILHVVVIVMVLRLLVLIEPCYT